MRGWARDTTGERGPNWWTEKVMELCAVGGCASGASHRELMAVQMGGHAVELEVYLCDYHWGWHDASKP